MAGGDARVGPIGTQNLLAKEDLPYYAREVIAGIWRRQTRSTEVAEGPTRTAVVVSAHILWQAWRSLQPACRRGAVIAARIRACCCRGITAPKDKCSAGLRPTLERGIMLGAQGRAIGRLCASGEMHAGTVDIATAEVDSRLAAAIGWE